jgi:hypothetical protein
LLDCGVDVVLQEPIDTEAAVCAPYLPIIGIARVDFLELLANEIDGCLRLGSVRNSDGRTVDQLATYVCPNPVPIRGGPGSRYDRCPSCRGFRYWAAPPRYVVQSDLSDRGLYGLAHAGLLVTPRVAKLITVRNWHHLELEKVQVSLHPRDGIERFPKDFFYRGPGVTEGSPGSEP